MDRPFQRPDQLLPEHHEALSDGGRLAVARLETDVDDMGSEYRECLPPGARPARNNRGPFHDWLAGRRLCQKFGSSRNEASFLSTHSGHNLL